jgi:TonB family protein
MRLSLFFFISIALHAAALSYAAGFSYYQREDSFRGVVVTLADTSGVALRGERAEGNTGKPAEAKHHAMLRQAENRDSKRSEQIFESREPTRISFGSIEAPATIGVVMAPSTESVGSLLSWEMNGSEGGGGPDGKGNSGNGSGSGVAVGEESGGPTFVQVSYGYNPKPEYPDRARREGKEGRVLLRVLVDEQGRSKSIEVNNSSGSEALDRAAGEAIKRWRFSPARYGVRPVESWIKIPVDFRLRDE